MKIGKIDTFYYMWLIFTHKVEMIKKIKAEKGRKKEEDNYADNGDFYIHKDKIYG